MDKNTSVIEAIVRKVIGRTSDKVERLQGVGELFQISRLEIVYSRTKSIEQ